jgi:FkbM family methyltransferase
MNRFIRAKIKGTLSRKSINRIREFKSKLKRYVLRSKRLSRVLGYKYFGLDNLDEKLEVFLDYENGYFVELGANDGLKQSNTLHLEIYHNWSGVLVEPEGRNYENLLLNRSKNNSFFNNGCVGFSYSDPTLKLVYSDLMTTPILSNSDIGNQYEHATKGNSHFEGENFVFEVKARTLQSILIESNSPKRIDFLSLDVEGGEMEVLEGLDHKTFRFQYMLIESRSPKKLEHYMNANDYLLVGLLSNHDYLYKDSTIV